MPRRIELTSHGRRYWLVPAHALRSFDASDVARLVRIAAEDGTLPSLARALSIEPSDHQGVAGALSRALERGQLVVLDETDDALQLDPIGLGACAIDWDDLPSLSDLVPEHRDDPDPARPGATRTLLLELVDYTGIAYGGLELEVHLPGGERRPVRLDPLGRLSLAGITDHGNARVILPAHLELSDADRRRPPIDGFIVRSHDLRVARAEPLPLDLSLEQNHRIVVDPPAQQASTSFPAAMFASEYAFPQPGIVHLVKYAQELTDQDSAARIGLFGHTDESGDASGNKLLAERRAQAAYAILVGDHALFAEVAAAEDWPLAHYQTMLRVLGCNPSAIDGEQGEQTELAVRMFRRDYNRDTWHEGARPRALGNLPDGDELDDATKRAIVDAYHAEHAGKVDPGRFVGPKHMGCGELNPLGPDHQHNRRVTLAIYRSDAPSDAAFPCERGNVGACQVDGADGFSCRFYRERIREREAEQDLIPFWDFSWLRTESGKAHLSALTYLPDTNDAELVIGRGRLAVGDDDSGDGTPPLPGVEVARVPGLIRGGVAYGLWPFEDDPFDVALWYVERDRKFIREYQPPFFTISAHGKWGRSDAPSFRLRDIRLGAEVKRALVLATTGEIVVGTAAELASAPDHLRVSAIRIPGQQSEGFQT